MPFRTASKPYVKFRSEDNAIQEAARRGDKTYTFYMHSYRDGRNITERRVVLNGPLAGNVIHMQNAVRGLLKKGFTRKQILSYVDFAMKRRERT